MTTKLVDDLMDLFGELADEDTRQCLSGDLASVGAATLEVGERQEVVGVRARQTVRAAGLLTADRCSNKSGHSSRPNRDNAS